MILNEALAVASLCGLAGISIGSLASRLGLSKSGLFAHFGSKEALQQRVLEEISNRFVEAVIRPALALSTGEERLRTCFMRWLQWTEGQNLPGGCPMLAAVLELDDQPGRLRDYIEQQQQSWLSSISKMAQRAIRDGVFRGDLDTRQFAFDMNSIGLGYNLSKRLLRDVEADRRAMVSFERLLADAHIT